MGLAKMLLLFRCLVKREINGYDLEFRRYMKCVALSNKADEALNCVRLQCAV